MDPAQELASRVAASLYARDAAAQKLQIRILEVGPGRARLVMRVLADMLNAHGIAHGGLVFALADTAFAYACNSYDRATVAAAASIEFLRPANAGDELVAVAEERSRVKRTGVYDVAVHNQQGECVAMFRGRSHEIGTPVIAADR